MSITTNRLILHPVDEEEARRILDRTPGAGDDWAADYPFDGDLAGIGAFLRATERHGEQRPFGYYAVSVRSGGVTVGGIGFKGGPREGVVEVGYGLAPSARGKGYATEALQAIVDLSRTLGIATIRADTDFDNVGSQRVLEKAGFHEAHRTAAVRSFEIHLQRSAE